MIISVGGCVMIISVGGCVMIISVAIATTKRDAD